MSDEKEKPFDPFYCQRCQKEMGVDDHTCPFAEDVNGDSETLCNCCDSCRGECADCI